MRWLVLVVLCLSCSSLQAKTRVECWSGTRERIVQPLSGGFVLHLLPLPEVDKMGEGCHAQVLDPQHKKIYSTGNWMISIAVTDQDVNGDGSPDLVLEGYSGGAHCCWTYQIISLGSHPGLLTEFENERGAGFVLNKSTGRVEIRTNDGAFDYFDGLCHACTIFPDVYLRLDGKSLIDISREHRADYDKKISELKSAIAPKGLAAFIQAENRKETIGWEHVSSKVLGIVQAYLYSGRPVDARSALRKMWPAFDQDRAWKLILKTRRKGILTYASGTPT